MNITSHFVILTYPFHHRIDRESQPEYLRKISKRWNPWWSRFDEEGLKRALDDSYFFLPYIRELINPASILLPPGDAHKQILEAKRLSQMDVVQFAKLLPKDGMMKLTLAPQQFKQLESLVLEFEPNRFSAPVKIDWIDIVLCPQNVGFLQMKVQLDEPNPTIHRLNEFLYLIRLILPPRIGWRMATLRSVAENQISQFSTRELVDFLLQGFTKKTETLLPDWKSFYDAIRGENEIYRYSHTDKGVVYGQVFREYIYACMDEIPSESNEKYQGMSNQSGIDEYDTGSIFSSRIQKSLYELATCTDTSKPEYMPHPMGLQQVMKNSHFAMWANWEGMALHDNVVFLGTTPSRFILGDFALNVENNYYNTYTLALYQKLRLSMLSGELVRHGDNLQRNLREARTLWNNFLMFRNHCWFAEVTFRPQGNSLYQKFHEGMNVLTLFEQVSGEVDELQEHYERKSDRRTSQLLNFLTFIGLPAGLLISMFSNALVKNITWADFILYFVIAYAISGSIWLIWRFIGR